LVVKEGFWGFAYHLLLVASLFSLLMMRFFTAHVAVPAKLRSVCPHNDRNRIMRPVASGVLVIILLLGSPLQMSFRDVYGVRGIEHFLTGNNIGTDDEMELSKSVAPLMAIDGKEGFTKEKIKEQDKKKDRNENKVHDVLEAGGGSFEIIVKFDNASGSIKAEDLKKQYGLKNVQTFRAFDWLGISEAKKELVYKLSKRSDVEFVELVGSPLIPEIVSGLDVSVRAMSARASSLYSPNTAEDLGVTGMGVNICIVDSGIDDTIHESLKGKFVAGFNALTDTIENPDDDNGHGTHVAGIALGKGGGPSRTYAGIAPAAGLIDVKVLDSSGKGTVVDVIQGIDFCKFYKDSYNIDVLSISVVTPGFHSAGDDIISQAVNSAVDSGLVVAACAGNDGPTAGTITSPGAADKAITVGNLNDNGSIDRSDDAISSSSSRGPRIDDGDFDLHDEMKPEITAIGSNIISAQFNSEAGYTASSGCSMATPAVAGLAALLMGFNPQATPDKVKNWLMESVEDKGNSGEVFDSTLSDKYDIENGFGEARFLLITGKSEKDEYLVGETIEISGRVFPDDSLQPIISVTVLAEDDSVLLNDQTGASSDGIYSYSFETNREGLHTVKLAYGGAASETTFNAVSDSPPNIDSSLPSIVAPPKTSIQAAGYQTNLCQNLEIASAAASGSDSASNTPNNIIDNNLSTRWSNLGVGSWITMNLGSTKVVCNVDIGWHQGDARASDFVVSVSTDGTVFKDVFSGMSSGTTLSQEKYEFPDSVARYLRITVNGNSANDWAGMTEVDTSGYTVLGLPSVSDNADTAPLVQNDASSNGFPVGSTNLVWTATDLGGNSASATQEVVFGDFVKPSMTFSSPTNGANIQLGVALEVKGSASDLGLGLQKVEVRTKDPDGFLSSYQVTTPKAAGDWSSWSTFRTFTKSGVYTIYGKVTDNVGNLNWQTLSITVILIGADTAKPLLKITSPPIGTSVTGSLSGGAGVIIAGTAFDAGSGIQKVEVRTISSSGSSSYKLAIPASADWSSWTHHQLLASSGTYTISVRAMDNAGISQWATTTVQVTLA
jgi:subtilisin family serine protease